MSNQFPINGHSGYFQTFIMTNDIATNNLAYMLFLFVEVHFQNVVRVRSRIARYKNRCKWHFGTP